MYKPVLSLCQHRWWYAILCHCIQCSKGSTRVGFYAFVCVCVAADVRWGRAAECSAVLGSECITIIIIIIIVIVIFFSLSLSLSRFLARVHGLTSLASLSGRGKELQQSLGLEKAWLFRAAAQRIVASGDACLVEVAPGYFRSAAIAHRQWRLGS